MRYCCSIQFAVKKFSKILVVYDTNFIFDCSYNPTFLRRELIGRLPDDFTCFVYIAPFCLVVRGIAIFKCKHRQSATERVCAA